MPVVASPVVHGVSLCLSTIAFPSPINAARLLSIGIDRDGALLIILLVLLAVSLFATWFAHSLPEVKSERQRLLEASRPVDTRGPEFRADNERRNKIVSDRQDQLYAQATKFIQSAKLPSQLLSVLNNPPPQEDTFFYYSWTAFVAARTRVFDEAIISKLLAEREARFGLAGNPLLPERYVKPIIQTLLPSCGRYHGFAHGMGTQPARAALSNLISLHKLDASYSIARELFAFVTGRGSSPVSVSSRSFDRRDAIFALGYFPDWPAHWHSIIDDFDKGLTQQDELARG